MGWLTFVQQTHVPFPAHVTAHTPCGELIEREREGERGREREREREGSGRERGGGGGGGGRITKGRQQCQTFPLLRVKRVQTLLATKLAQVTISVLTTG